MVLLVGMDKLDVILANDQLQDQMKEKKTFVDFFEGEIKFPPTYRCLKGTFTMICRLKRTNFAFICLKLDKF